MYETSAQFTCVKQINTTFESHDLTINSISHGSVNSFNDVFPSHKSEGQARIKCSVMKSNSPAVISIFKYGRLQFELNRY